MNIFNWFRRKNKDTDKVVINKKVNLGIALGGGGCRGIGHIGVLKAFEELGVKFDYIAGTSAGSIIASLYALGKTPAEMETIIKGIKKSDVTKGSIAFIKPAKTEKLENLMNKIYGDLKVFSELSVPLSVVCTDLKTGKEVDFNYGNVAKVVSASCAVPGVFTPVVHEDMHLVDGGLRNNVPVDVVKNMGANVVFAVDATGSMKNDIEYLRQNLIPQLEAELLNFGSVRLGLLLYRDYGDNYTYQGLPVKFFDFVYTSDEFYANLNDFKIRGNEGGDVPEAVYEALYGSMEFYNWDPKAQKKIILIGDAEPHKRPRGSIKCTKEMVLELSRQKNILIDAIIIPED
jgi:predicted acylesterase/phospholipase RssA